MEIELGGADLRGRVVDSRLDLGVEAWVRLLGDGGKTLDLERSSAEGEFQFRDLEDGAYDLEVTADRYASESVRGIQVGAQAKPLTVRLTAGGSSSLRVRLRRHGNEPAAHVLLTLLRPSGETVRSLPTDAHGERDFDDLPAGDYFLVWSDPVAGVGSTRPIRLRAATPRSLDLTLRPGPMLRLDCTSAQCRNLPVELVDLRTAEDLPVTPFLSGLTPGLRFSPDGQLTLGRVSPARYRLRLRAGGYEWSLRLTVAVADPSIHLSTATATATDTATDTDTGSD